MLVVFAPDHTTSDFSTIVSTTDWTSTFLCQRILQHKEYSRILRDSPPPSLCLSLFLCWIESRAFYQTPIKLGSADKL